MKYLKYRLLEADADFLLPYCESNLKGLPLYADIVSGLIDFNGVTVGETDDGEVRAVIYHNTMEYCLVWKSPDAQLARLHELPDFDRGGYTLMQYVKKPSSVSGVYMATNLDSVTQCVSLAFSGDDAEDRDGALYKMVKRINAGLADVFCTVDGGKVTSTAAVVAKNKKYALIGNIFTLENRRREGLAGRLINACADKCLKEGLTPVLYCEEELVPYYIKQGFERIDG